MATKDDDNNHQNAVTVDRQGLSLVLHTEKGRAVYARENIPAGTIIEVSPVLVLPPADVSAIAPTVINHYSYNWPYRIEKTGEDTTTQAIALGLGSIFNHSRRQNVGFTRDFEKTCIIYSTLRDVEAGEELCISYGPRLWFNDVDQDDVETDNPLEDISRIALDLPENENAVDMVHAERRSQCT